uniref:Uncharacterized protein n=1 Tax=Rhabditophanes sp. KR3021 TaxID=114890 RepID=A0AC35UA57_9BILA
MDSSDNFSWNNYANSTNDSSIKRKNRMSMKEVFIDTCQDINRTLNEIAKTLANSKPVSYSNKRSKGYSISSNKSPDRSSTKRRSITVHDSLNDSQMITLNSSTVVAAMESSSELVTSISEKSYTNNDSLYSTASSISVSTAYEMAEAVEEQCKDQKHSVNEDISTISDVKIESISSKAELINSEFSCSVILDEPCFVIKTN